MLKRFAAILILMGLLPLTMVGQGSFSKLEVGLNGGGMNYIGDLNNQSMLGKPNVGYGAMLRYKLDNRWSVVVGGSYSHLEGGNPDYIARRNLSFRSYVGEGYVRLDFNFFPYGYGDMQFPWTPYIFGGMGFFVFNPTAYYTDPLTGESEWVDLQPLGTEGQGLLEYPDRTQYNLLQACMPFGLGVKMMVAKPLTIAVEYGWRKTWTDYIDDCSTTYVDNTLLAYSRGDMTAGLADRSGEVVEGYVNAAGMKRGDDSLNDWYAYLNVSATLSLDFLFRSVLKKKCNNK